MKQYTTFNRKGIGQSLVANLIVYKKVIIHEHSNRNGKLAPNYGF